MSQIGACKGDSCAFFALFSIMQEIFEDFGDNPLFNTHGIYVTFLRPLIEFSTKY